MLARDHFSQFASHHWLYLTDSDICAIAPSDSHLDVLANDRHQALEQLLNLDLVVYLALQVEAVELENHSSLVVPYH